MRDRRPVTTHGYCTTAGEEASLNSADFLGSFPTADYRLQPTLPEIAFLGRSNVGKSTLINELTGRRSLARTSKTPGKTQTCNVYRIDQRFYLIDLPGYGYAHASHDRRRAFLKLLRDYLSTRDACVGIVWLLDIRREPSPDDLVMGELLAERGTPVLAAVTKIDKIGRAQRSARGRAIVAAVQVPEDQCVLTSARTGEGIEDLRRSVQGLIASGSGG